jgi:hypothetical protein
MRAVNKQRAPLLIIDLPKEVESVDYEELVAAGNNVRQLSDALVAVCGLAETPREEIWARSQGVWSYFNGIDARDGMALLLREARVALEQIAQRSGRLPGGSP